jgi:hypothetical protein
MRLRTIIRIYDPGSLAGCLRRRATISKIPRRLDQDELLAIASKYGVLDEHPRKRAFLPVFSIGRLHVHHKASNKSDFFPNMVQEAG